MIGAFGIPQEGYVTVQTAGSFVLQPEVFDMEATPITESTLSI